MKHTNKMVNIEFNPVNGSSFMNDLRNKYMEKQTAVEWLESRITVLVPDDIGSQLMYKNSIKKAKEVEKEQKGYTEEQAKQIWKAGQEYWKTSGSSITFEELIETFNTKEK
jgi:hypothetical protein